MLYARSDVCAVAVPVTSGGCGTTHSRPVRNGAPVKVWGLDCPGCEGFLRGDGKQKIIKVTPGDIKNGIAPRQERVADMNPMWSSSQDAIPLTPDQQNLNGTRKVIAEQQMEMIKTIAAAKAAGVNIPPEAAWLMEDYLPPGVIRGTVLCSMGHDNPAGQKYCGSCGVSMDAKAPVAELSAPEPEPAIDYYKLDINSLRKICREKGLPAGGGKEQLIGRLK